MSNYRVIEKALMYELQNEGFSNEFKEKAFMFTQAFATAIVLKFTKTELHTPFRSNIGLNYLTNFNDTAVWSMRNYIAQFKPFNEAIDYSFSKNKHTPSVLSLCWNYDQVIEHFPEFAGYNQEQFEIDTTAVLDIKLKRFTLKHLTNQRKLKWEPFWELEKLGNIRSATIDDWKKTQGKMIHFNTYLGYFFCFNCITGNLDENSSIIR